jgi:hypothetical protein
MCHVVIAAKRDSNTPRSGSSSRDPPGKVQGTFIAATILVICGLDWKACMFTLERQRPATKTLATIRTISRFIITPHPDIK